MYLCVETQRWGAVWRVFVERAWPYEWWAVVRGWEAERGQRRRHKHWDTAQRNTHSLSGVRIECVVL